MPLQTENAMTEQLSPLPPHLIRSADHTPDQTFTEIMGIIGDAITNHPRSLQKAIGPSEVGTPCPRKIGYKLLEFPERQQEPNWAATVGTAVHQWLETVFDHNNLATAVDGQERWYIESRVDVGDYNGTPVIGSSDLFDRATLSNWDWKVVGPTQLTKYRRHGPGPQYVGQAHLYGRGWHRAGIGCRTVNIVFLPRNGKLDEAVHWTAPYDEQTAVDALQRLSGIALATQMLGTNALQHLDTVDNWCTSCAFYRAASTDLSLGCPGDQTTIDHLEASTGRQLAGLI